MVKKTSQAILCSVLTLTLINLWNLPLPAEEQEPGPGHPIFMSPGGPYTGTVGKPIKFDASNCCNTDDDRILGYYWDWLGDGRLAVYSLPECEHTWHSAWSGKVGLYIFDEGDDLGFGEADVTVTGPTVEVWATLNSHAHLHVEGPRKRHVGLNYETGELDTQLPDGGFAILDPNGNEMAFSGEIPDDCSQTIHFPLYMGGEHELTLVGTGNGPFDLVVCLTKDGQCVAEKAFSGDICEGERVTLDLVAISPDGEPKADFGELRYRPGFVVEPGDVKLMVEAGTTYEVELTIREVYGKVPLTSVKLSNDKIEGAVNSVNRDAVRFSASDFEVPAGGAQTVVASIPVPGAFLGQAVGDLVIKSGSGGTQKVNVTLKTTGNTPPHANPTGPYAGTVGTPITFDASNSYDPDGYIMFYAWDWDGDGNYEYTNQAQIQHTWDAPFDDTIELLIVDDQGNPANTMVQVTVTPVP
jgi:hypothetical protein